MNEHWGRQIQSTSNITVIKIDNRVLLGEEHFTLQKYYRSYVGQLYTVNTITSEFKDTYHTLAHFIKNQFTPSILEKLHSTVCINNYSALAPAQLKICLKLVYESRVL